MVMGSEADFAAVTCSDNNMLPAACCSLLSVRNNLAGPARFMLVGLDLSAEAAEAVSAFGNRHGFHIDLIRFDSARLPKAQKGRWARSALTRLFLAEMLPSDLRRVLYLDADALAVAALDALRDFDLGDNCAAAVEDYIMAFPAKIGSRRRTLGLGEGSAYFNSGVILFDWQDPRVEAALSGAVRKICDDGGALFALDQDALNVTLEGQWARLDPRWNTQTGFMRDIPDPAILHFTGRRKPWQAGASWQHRDQSDLYASWLAGTEWEMSFHPPGTGQQVFGYALHLGKRLEGLRKERKVSAYIDQIRSPVSGPAQR